MEFISNQRQSIKAFWVVSSWLLRQISGNQSNQASHVEIDERIKDGCRRFNNCKHCVVSAM